MADGQAVLKKIEIESEIMELNKENICFLCSSFSYSHKVNSTVRKTDHGSMGLTLYLVLCIT